MASRRVVNPSTGAIPKQPRGGSAGPSRPGSAKASRPGSAGSSKATESATKKGIRMPPPCPKAAEALKKKQKMEGDIPPPRKIFDTPAFSIPLKKVQTNPLLADKDKKRTIRRNIPPGEDITEMKRIIVSLKKHTDITVGEFIALIAPSTGDNGEVLRTVLNDDMNSFRNLARKIYDTMTQDVSDVLTNQTIQLKEFEQEKVTLYTEKMMKAINEIYSYAAKFDFESYYRDSEGYLATLFPVPRVIEKDSEEAEMHRRQQAYHRLNWLKTEGERLAAENVRLQARLNELKREQQEEMLSAEAREAEAEARRVELEAEEAATQQKLEHLSEKVEKTLIDTEAALRVATDECNITSTKTEEEASKATASRRRRKKAAWSTETAVEIEEKVIEETVVAEGAQTTVQQECVAGAISRVRSKASRTKFKRTSETTPERGAGPQKPTSPFHFSPIKTPPSKAPPSQEKSPFHFSPIKTPPPKVQIQGPPSPFHYSPPRSPAAADASSAHPPQLHTTRLRTEKVTMQERTPQSRLFPSSEFPTVTPQGGLAASSGSKPQSTTPYDQPIPEASHGAPQKESLSKPQKPGHLKLQDFGMSGSTPTAPAAPAARRERPAQSSTTSDKKTPETSQAAPQKESVTQPQKSGYLNLQDFGMPGGPSTSRAAPAARRGREHAPKDSWGGLV
ncbi:hypothetical protein WA026_001393 [Henosepilachna vigintioctopunctata]|uniref:Uncharacterized protein n=1 Tax=Henosepilachna vigintioctopunctata TaxID=420089 RepID=A0AAW1UTP7_9CUCU